MIYGVNYHVLSSLIAGNNKFNFPRTIKDIVRQGEINNAAELTETIKNEIQNCQVTDTSSENYFWFLSECGLMYSLLRDDFMNYLELKESIQKRVQTQETGGSEILNSKDWKDFFAFMHLYFERINRKVSIEHVESVIENLDWSEMGEEFIPRYSGWVGLLFLNEEKPESKSKAKFWLEKACAGNDLNTTLLFFVEKANFLMKENRPDSAQKIEKYISVFNELANDNSIDAGLGQLFRYAVIEMHSRALLNRIGTFDDHQVRLEETLSSLRDVERNFDLEGRNAPHFLKAFMKLEFAKAFIGLGKATVSKEDAEDLFLMAADCIELAGKSATASGDEPLSNNIRLHWLEVMSYRSAKVAEKDIRDTALIFKRGEMHKAWAEAYGHLVRYYISQGAAQKGYEAITDLLKSSLKNPTEGGLYLFTRGFSLANDIMLLEIEKPGISWIINEMADHFTRIAEAADLMEASGPAIGLELFSEFRNEYVRFEKVSHFNILVYFRYQWYAIRLMRAGASLSGDEMGMKIAENLIKSLSEKNNPMSVIKADWADFKDEPNEFRNKVINKCISITKGDLPAASDHLVFSYRNLRSYITFKEVNRLGFFLDEQATNQKQLEQGIRLMFHDMYKDGTIFEVVFDMPKFLVKHAVDGFTSQDLEETLDIKGTTAKKYIKFMIDAGIIHYDKSQGRKHFFRLRRTNIMNRFGQEQKVVVES